MRRVKLACLVALLLALFIAVTCPIWVRFV
jgi:hypothetical protein